LNEGLAESTLSVPPGSFHEEEQMKFPQIPNSIVRLSLLGLAATFVSCGALEDNSVDEVNQALTFKRANLTNFESYPAPDSEECREFNGCKWAGQFAALDGKQPLSWVKSHNIAAVHEKDFNKYKLKKLRLKKDGEQIDVTVYDMCSDSDCDGCCTKNAKKTGFLIDIEKFTKQRFGVDDGIVEWACLDCK
jgi:hypothetical protein